MKVNNIVWDKGFAMAFIYLIGLAYQGEDIVCLNSLL
jgi:hypothetical protein